MASPTTQDARTIADNLRTRISTGDLAAGAYLPSEPQLTEMFGVSRYTARKALAALAADGLIVVVRGKGSYVRIRSDRARFDDTRTLHTNPTRPDPTGLDTGAHTDSAVFDDDFAGWATVEAPSTYQVNAGPDVALSMGIPEHTPLFGVDRLLTRRDPADNRRMTHRLTVPFDTALAVPALEDDPFVTPDGLYAALTAAGIAFTVTEHVRAVVATPDDYTSLALAPGAVVFVTRRLIRATIGGGPLALEETRRGAEDVQLTHTITPTVAPRMPTLARPATGDQGNRARNTRPAAKK